MSPTAVVSLEGVGTARSAAYNLPVTIKGLVAYAFVECIIGEKPVIPVNAMGLDP
jgi:hypothetical protein